MLNPYFKTMTQTNEQDLSHDLVTEIIQMSGMDVYYIRMESTTAPEFSRLFGENRFEKLRDCFLIEMRPIDFEAPFVGDDFFTPVGLTINKRITFEVGYRRIESILGGRPKEGDYIFIPAVTPREMNDVFKIMYVETDEPEWNPQGTILRYNLKCEQATFGHQELNTGIDALDFSLPKDIAEGEGDVQRDNELIQELSDIFIEFDENHPFGKP